jgi:hypothetical protein
MGLDKFNRLFFTPESVNLEGAFRKPRLGEAIYMFKDQNLERLFDTPTRTGEKADPVQQGFRLVAGSLSGH